MRRHILFIGRFFPPGIYNIIREDSNGTIGFSNHNFEMSLIKGLLRHKEIDTDIISVPGIYSYPSNSKTFYVKSENFLIEGAPARSIGFCNLILVNKLFSIISLLFAIIKYIRGLDDQKVEIIVDTPKIHLLLPILWAKVFTRKSVSAVLVLPDIPTMITQFNKQNPIKKQVVDMFDGFSMYLASKMDAFVLLTDEMKNFFKAPIKYTVVEGIIDEKGFPKDIEKNGNDKIVFLYTGTLNRFFGITTLLDAFELIDRDNVELWICGSGDTRELLEERCKSNPKIKYLGLLDVDSVRKLQKQVDVLVNPRGSDGEFTKYSFPSKTLEYLLSGNVVIINKLPGIPQEYYNYTICPEDESTESLADAMRRVADMSEQQRGEIGKKGLDFIMAEKNSYVQVEKILDLFSNF